MPTQQRMFIANKQQQTSHKPLAEKPGECGTKVLLRSKGDPTKRRWQCTNSQREMFKDKHATSLMREAKGGETHISRRRAEHPSIRKLHDEGLVKISPNPKHYNYEFKVELTQHGKNWNKERAESHESAAKKRQTGLFKGDDMAVIRLVMLSKGVEDAPNYRASDNGTTCSMCRFASAGNCELYNFRYTPGWTCDAWEPANDSTADLPAPGNGRKGRAVTDLVPESQRFKLEHLRALGHRVLQLEGLSKADAVGEEVGKLIHEGKPKKQAVAIALDMERRGKLTEASITASTSSEYTENPASISMFMRAGGNYQKADTAPSGYMGGPAEDQKRNQARLVIMAKASVGKPIVEMDEVLARPPNASWTVGPYKFAFRSGKYMCAMTTTGGNLALPFHQLCRSITEARSMCRDTARAFDAGLVPEVGVYRRLNVRRRKRGDQGGVKL